MPVPDFSPGEVLTANAMDSIGLWRVGGGPLSGTATNFAGVFSSDFTDYRIVIDSIGLGSPGEMYWQLLDGTTPATTNYRYGYQGINTNGTTTTQNSNSATEAYTGVLQSGFDGIILCSLIMDIFAPNLPIRTFANNHAVGFSGGNASRYGISMNNNQVSYDGIRFLTASAVTLAGNVNIYGYRK